MHDQRAAQTAVVDEDGSRGNVDGESQASYLLEWFIKVNTWVIAIFICMTEMYLHGNNVKSVGTKVYNL